MTRIHKNEIECGSIIKFGSYRKTQIEWRVLAKDRNKVLLISEKALECKPYHTTQTNITWEKCALRKWLNNNFFNDAFTKGEQKAIQATYVTADGNPEYGTFPGNATTDKVFLLSIDEVNKYFESDEDRKCVPTAYVKIKGAWTTHDFTNAHIKNGKRICWWWLRSPGNDQDDAAYVNSGGWVVGGGSNVNDGLYCVRPALWIILDS